MTSLAYSGPNTSPSQCVLRPSSRGRFSLDERDQPAGHRPPAPVHHLDRRTLVEPALHPHDPRGQQRGVLGHQRAHRAVVDDQPAARGAGVRQPQHPRRGPRRGRREQRPDVRPGQGLVRQVGAGQQGEDAGACGDPGGLDLGHHAAGADAGGGVPEPDVVEIPAGGDHRQPGDARLARRAVVQRIDVREQQQRVRADQVGEQRGQPVVVAEPDVVGGDGVVLVDHRYDAQAQQPVHRPPGVAVVLLPDQVVGGQQHLPDGQAVRAERLRVRRDQSSLPDARRRLLRGQVLGAPGQAEREDAGGHRPGGDQDHLDAGARAYREHVDQRGERVHVEEPVGRRQGTRPDLDHEPLRIVDPRRGAGIADGIALRHGVGRGQVHGPTIAPPACGDETVSRATGCRVTRSFRPGPGRAGTTRENLEVGPDGGPRSQQTRSTRPGAPAGNAPSTTNAFSSSSGVNGFGQPSSTNRRTERRR